MALDPHAEAGIRRTLARYCQRCDDGDFEAFAELFAADATFTVHGFGEPHVGRDAIKGFMAASMPPEKRGKHLIAQSDIDVDGVAGTATAVTDYTFVAGANFDYAVTSAGRYYDRMVKGDDDVWRFAAREIRFL
jgi:uncharacterized protein (TIGR02246 family)